MKLAVIIVLLCFVAISVHAWGKCDKKIGAEYLEKDEEANNFKTTELSIQNLHAAFQGKKYLRDAHPKSHGCVKAYFDVDDNVPTKYRVGVFKQPGKRYQAWIRYSNGSPSVQSDTSNDSRGMAVKLMGVPGKKLLDDESDATTQDFIAANAPQFFLEKASDYVGFFEAARKGALGIIGFFLKSLKFKELYLVRKFTSNPIGNPLTSQYWSVTPYALGADRAVKFTFLPVDCKTGAAIKDVKPGDSENYLRERMTRTLSASDACFDFMIQEQEDACKQPVEDSRAEWSTKFVKVARVTVFQQHFDETAKQLEFCENMSFTPWHSLPEHRPLGGINRCRKVVYKAISKIRHTMNSAPRREPTEW